MFDNPFMVSQAEIDPEYIPEEYIRLSFGFLDSAEKLNDDIAANNWKGDFHREQAITWLVFHATELFLKGSILQLAPAASVNGHDLWGLAQSLNDLKPELNFQLLFGIDAPTDMEKTEDFSPEQKGMLHQRFKYPTNTNGKPWPGVQGHSAVLFSKELSQFRAQVENTRREVFPMIKWD